MSSENEKVFFKPYLLVLGVIGAFLVLISSMIVANNDEPEVAATSAENAASTKTSSEKLAMAAVEERTAPVGQVRVAAASGAEGAESAAEVSVGQKTYDTVCAACHGLGIAGAPKFGEKAAWTARIEQGNETLYDHAINGFTGSSGMMPAKGGRADVADDDIKAAVDYMLEAVGVAGSAPAAAKEAEPASKEAMVETVKEVNVVETPTDVAPVAASGKGKEVYDAACFLCHTPGAGGAPKFGDKEAWAPRLEQECGTLYAHAIKGFVGKSGIMPAKGGQVNIPDEDIISAVDYMIENSQ